jgi:hypothetical protein
MAVLVVFMAVLLGCATRKNLSQITAPGTESTLRCQPVMFTCKLRMIERTKSSDTSARCRFAFEAPNLARTHFELL